MNELALCAGNGGLSLGLRLAEPEARTVCLVEREAFVCADLVRKMQAEHLDQAPIWTDLVTFDARAWRGAVGIITAGFPCQPFSAAGSRLGTADPRWLWPHIERIIGECEPGYVFLENVPGLRRHGLVPIIQGLTALGFDAEWDIFSAAQVGAPHLRKRFFLLAAHTDSRGLQEQRGQGLLDSERPALGDDPDGCGGALADADSPRPQERQGQPGDSRSERETIERDGWWQPEPRLGRVVDGAPNRVDRLRSIGNGVVPLAVAYAFCTLAARFDDYTED